MTAIYLQVGFIWIVIVTLKLTAALSSEQVDMAIDFYLHRNVKRVSYLSCAKQYMMMLRPGRPITLSLDNKDLVKSFMGNDILTSVMMINAPDIDFETALYRDINIGVLLDASCNYSEFVLETASKARFLDSLRIWLVVADWKYDSNDTMDHIDKLFQHLNLSIDADITVASCYGLSISLEGFKYYNRWDFHNLTLRAVSVIMERPEEFKPEMLTSMGYTAGVSAMTKIVSQLLQVLKEQHNFRFNYTIVGRWIGSPVRNSTLAVTNSLFWREQDISSTCVRIYPKWLDWMDPFLPPATQLETKFYYLIPDKGVGDYENRFLTPMSASVWWCSFGAGVICVLVLIASAMTEDRPDPGSYALFSVVAAICQQAYEDGVQMLDNAFSSQGRQLALLVVGLMSMLLYNYYTSSVVSWLLNASAPTIATMDGLIDSNIELVFEDIGYTRQWLYSPGFYYYSGFKNIKEDELRDKKVQNAKRSTPLLQQVGTGIELVRSGGFAYHTEPYTASQVISRTFDDNKLCALGTLQMMPPSHVYVVGQKHSPYKQFFVWSLMRLLERGHQKAAQARVGGQVPACSGRTPRALALGQAAPAFLLLLEITILSLIILVAEIMWHRFRTKSGLPATPKP